MRTRRILVAFVTICFSYLFYTASEAAEAPRLNLAEHRGKVVVLDFWASWCAPCRRSFPWLDAMQQKYRDDGLVVIGVNEDADAAAAQRFLEDYPVRFRILEDPAGRLATQYELLAMPSSYVIGRDGEIVARHLGFKTASTDEYERILRGALGFGAADPAADLQD